MKRVLLTGGSGFIGRHAIAPLLESGYEVHAVGSRATGAADVFWHTANLLEETRRESLLAEVKASHLLHFAWYAEHGKFWTAMENVTWVKASLDLMLSFAKLGGQRYVGAGTCAEYDWTGGGLLGAATPLRPATLYGASKHALQTMQSSIATQLSISFAWGRIFHLYGEGETPQRFIPSLIGALHRGQPARMTHGRQVRDFLHVEDVARAFVTLLDSKVEKPVNIGSGKGVELLEVAQLLAKLMDRADLLRVGELKPTANDPPELVADIHELNSLGFHPRYSLEAGLARTIRTESPQVS